MSGEVLLVRRALVWGAVATLAGAGIAAGFAGTRGAASVGLGAGLVLCNAALAGAMSALAGRIAGATAAGFVAIPSFAIRMGMLLTAMTMLQGRAFIIEPLFAAAFGLAVPLVLYVEARTWKRTPWIAMTLKENA